MSFKKSVDYLLLQRAVHQCQCRTYSTFICIPKLQRNDMQASRYILCSFMFFIILAYHLNTQLSIAKSVFWWMKFILVSPLHLCLKIVSIQLCSQRQNIVFSCFRISKEALVGLYLVWGLKVFFCKHGTGREVKVSFIFLGFILSSHFLIS